VSGLAGWCILFSVQPHRQIFYGFKSGDPAGHVLLSSFLQYYLSEIPLFVCRNLEILRPVVATVGFILSEVYFLKEPMNYFQEKSCHRELLKVSS